MPQNFQVRIEEYTRKAGEYGQLAERASSPGVRKFFHALRSSCLVIVELERLRRDSAEEISAVPQAS